MRLGSRPIGPYLLYLVLECGMSFLLSIAFTTVVVYWVTSGRLDPLQLLLLGTALELTYFLLQLPTGVLADLVSRRLFVLAGLFILGLALIMQSLSPAFGNLLAAQVVGGTGFAMLDGALEAWVADELGAEQITGVYLRATQYGLVATIAGSLLSGVVALGGLYLPLRIGGAGVCVLAIGASVVMPERDFRATGRAGETAGVVFRQARQLLVDQTKAAHRGHRGGAWPGTAVRHDALRRIVERELRPVVGRVPAEGHQVPGGRRPAPGDVVQPAGLRRVRAVARLDRVRQAPGAPARI